MNFDLGPGLLIFLTGKTKYQCDNMFPVLVLNPYIL